MKNADQTQKIRLFQGRETKQLDGVTSKKPKPSAWYWEPADYDGDVTFSRPCSSEATAVREATNWARQVSS